MFAKLKTGTKVLAGFGLAIAIAVAVGWFGYRGITKLGRHVQEIGALRLPSVQTLLEIKLGGEHVKTAQRTLLDANTPAEVRKQQSGLIAEARTNYEAAWKTYEQLSHSAAEESLWKQFVPAWGEWRKANTEFFRLAGQWDAVTEQGAQHRTSGKAYAVCLREAMWAVRNVDAAFSAQIQAWNSLLLRSSDAKLYARHRATYEQQERATREQLQALAERMKQLGQPPQTVAKLIALHADLGAKHRQALKGFDPANPAAGRLADKAAVESDRPFNAALGATLAVLTDTQSKLELLVQRVSDQALGACRENQVKANELLDRIIRLNVEAAAAANQQAQADSNSATSLMFIVIGVGAAALLALGVLLARNISGVHTALVGEARRLTTAAAAGQLQVRGNPQLVTAEFRPILDGMNSTLDAVVGPLRIAAQYLNRIAQGDIPELIADHFQGDFNEIKNSLNRCIESVNALLDAGQAVRRVAEGDLDARGDETRVTGSYREMIRTVNGTLESLLVPIREIGEVLKRLAVKDFSRDVEQEYPGIFGELRSNVNLVITNVRNAIEQITHNSVQCAEGSRVIAESSQTLATGAQSQSAGVEQMTATIEELTRSIEAVKANATEAAEVAAEADRLAENGGQAVAKSVESMAQIRSSSQQISEIIQVISEIAGQTNLLALNAAIEAARGGEHGMGFAVVADEVRKLAERSNQAAHEISALIKESTQKVEEGAALSDQTGESLKQIIKAAETTAAKIAEIAAATAQQANNAAEVSNAIQGIARGVEASAASSEEMAASSEELGAQANALRDLVGQFVIDAER